MRVIVDNKVHEALVDFYEVAKNRHVALGTRVIIRKMQRIYAGLEELGKYAHACPKARLRKDWVDKGYQEYVDTAKSIRKMHPEAEFQLLGSIDEAYPNHVPEEQVRKDVEAGYIR